MTTLVSKYKAKHQTKREQSSIKSYTLAAFKVFCVFVWVKAYVQINNFSVMLGHFPGLNQYWAMKMRLSCSRKPLCARWWDSNLRICDLESSTLPTEPRRQKTGLRGFRPGPTQTGLRSLRKWLEAWNFVFRQERDFTIRVAKTKPLISFAVYREADLRLCFSHMQKSGFLTSRLNWA